jgi:hypothetical protein
MSKVDQVPLLQFNDGCALDRDTLLIASREVSELDEQVSYVAILSRGKWRFIGFDDITVSVAALDQERQGFFLGDSGRVLVTGLGQRVVEDIPTEESLGEVLRIRNIADQLYVCGMTGQVYRRYDGKWLAIDEGIRGRNQLDLGDIGGTDPNNIYAVSSFGEIVHFNGKSWRILESPSNVPLTGIKVISESEIYVCGQDGIVLRGFGPDAWEVISNPEFNNHLYSAEWYRDRLYAAYDGGLLEWFRGCWNEVCFNLEGTIDCHALQARDSILFSFGYEHILAFDGSRWLRIMPGIYPVWNGHAQRPCVPE